MFSLANITLFKFSFGPSVTAVGKLGWSGGEPTKSEIAQLNVPWQELQPDPTLFSLLSWHTRISEFAGREKEMDQLKEWVTSDLPVSVKFVVGEGGVGKSRFGAEFAERMQKDDWAAGFVDPRKACAFPMHKAGTLLVIDYPEEHVKRVAELLKDLTQVGLDTRLRVLFLTRQTLDNWDETISSANANNIVDRYPVNLGRLDAQSATTVFNTTATEAIDKLQTDSAQEAGKALIPEEAMAQWLKEAPENDRALFVMAAAVYSAENPEEELVKYTGREIVKAIAKREADRYQRMAEERKLKDKYALARLLAMVAISDDQSVAGIKNIIADSVLPLGFQPDDDITDHLMTTGLLIDGMVRAPKPDIVAAAFVVEVLSRRPEHAPETVWAALESDIEGSLERFGRLSHDSEFVLNILDHRLSDWLANAVEGNLDRCRILEDSFSEGTLPLGLLKTATTMRRTLLEHTEDDEERAVIQNNQSCDLAEIGDMTGALKAAQEAVEILRRLAEVNPSRFEPALAAGLTNLSGCLSITDDLDRGLAAIQEAREILHRLAKANPSQFEPDLAGSLNNLSNRLSDAGKDHDALEAIREAVEIRRRLAKANSPSLKHNLAMSLNNLSNRLSDAGKVDDALKAIHEAVEIRRHLAKADPSRFEPTLAGSLNNLSGCLRNAGDHNDADALEAMQEVVAIYRRLAKANPARFEPDLAVSLSNLSGYLSVTGDTDGGLAAIHEAMVIFRCLSEANPAAFAPDLARCLGVMGITLLRLDRVQDATDTFKQGVELIRPYAQKWPGGPHERLLTHLERELKKALGESES